MTVRPERPSQSCVPRAQSPSPKGTTITSLPPSNLRSIPLLECRGRLYGPPIGSPHDVFAENFQPHLATVITCVHVIINEGKQACRRRGVPVCQGRRTRRFGGLGEFRSAETGVVRLEARDPMFDGRRTKAAHEINHLTCEEFHRQACSVFPVQHGHDRATLDSRGKS